MCYIHCLCHALWWMLGLVEFKKCAIFYQAMYRESLGLGLVEFKKCAILIFRRAFGLALLGLVEFKKCAIFLALR